MGLKQIKKVRVGDQVYEQVRSQIINGVWKTGEKIPSEAALIEALGVSRGTVRQALQKLTGEELIEARRGEGTFVRVSEIDSFFKTNTPLFHMGKREMREIFEFRSMFERSAAELAANKITPEQLAEMEVNYQQMKASANDLDKFMEFDLTFHNLICAATGNTLVKQIFQSYEPLLMPSIRRMVEVIGTENGIKYHELLIGALRSGDAVLARNTMIEHLESNVNLFDAEQ